MNISDQGFSVKVIEHVVVGAEEPWNDYWLAFTNLDLLVPPFEVSAFFCYKKPSHGSFPDMVNKLKASLSRALALYSPVAGDIVWNEAAGENQIHCNNQGVDFITAVADVELKELNFYNPDESIEGKLMPKKRRGVFVVQVTELTCGGIAIGYKFDHRIMDGYSANMFISSWADITRCETPSMFPSLGRSYLNPRCPTISSSSIDNMFAPLLPTYKTENDQNGNGEGKLLTNRIYYIEGAQLKQLQLLASENGCRRSKLEAFTSFLWKVLALSMDDPGKHNQECNVAITVDGRRRLSEGDGEEKEKLMVSHFGNVLSMPYGSKPTEVTELTCGGMVIGCKFDHRIVDGYSANMFISSWADITRCGTPSMFPSLGRSYLNPRCPTISSPSIDNVFAPYLPPSKIENDQNESEEDKLLTNRIFYIEGEQLKELQLLASENGCRRSKLEAFTSFLWKFLALSMKDPGKHNQVCNMVITVDGRRRLSEEDGEEKEKLMASHFGNVLSMLYGTIPTQELRGMPLSDIATNVHEFLETATTKEHFLYLIDWVAERRSQPLISKAFAGRDMSIIVSAGQRFNSMADKLDFGWGKLAFGSCHVPSERTDLFVMIMSGPINNEDWILYMHLPLKHIKYIEANGGHMFKPLNADYLNI